MWGAWLQLGERAGLKTPSSATHLGEVTSLPWPRSPHLDNGYLGGSLSGLLRGLCTCPQGWAPSKTLVKALRWCDGPNCVPRPSVHVMKSEAPVPRM